MAACPFYHLLLEYLSSQIQHGSQFLLPLILLFNLNLSIGSKREPSQTALRIGDAGHYSCQATSDVTSITQTSDMILTVECKLRNVCLHVTSLYVTLKCNQKKVTYKSFPSVTLGNLSMASMAGEPFSHLWRWFFSFQHGNAFPFPTYFYNVDFTSRFSSHKRHREERLLGVPHLLTYFRPAWELIPFPIYFYNINSLHSRWSCYERQWEERSLKNPLAFLTRMAADFFSHLFFSDAPVMNVTEKTVTLKRSLKI